MLHFFPRKNTSSSCKQKRTINIFEQKLWLTKITYPISNLQNQQPAKIDQGRKRTWGKTSYTNSILAGCCQHKLKNQMFEKKNHWVAEEPSRAQYQPLWIPRHFGFSVNNCWRLLTDLRSTISMYGLFNHWMCYRGSFGIGASLATILLHFFLTVFFTSWSISIPFRNSDSIPYTGGFKHKFSSTLGHTICSQRSKFCFGVSAFHL